LEASQLIIGRSVHIYASYTHTDCVCIFIDGRILCLTIPVNTARQLLSG